MPQRIDDILLNLNEEYLKQNINSFNLDDLRQKIYEIVSIDILRNNLYTEIFKENRSLEKSLAENLYINKNRLIFNIERLVEENIAKHLEEEKIALSNKLLKLAKSALAEFLIYITKQTVASKNMLAEAEGVLDRYTIVGTDIVRFHLHGTEYQVQLSPYQAKPAADNSLRKKLLSQLRSRLEKIQKKLTNFINSQTTDALSNYFRKQAEKILNPTLQRTTNMLTELNMNDPAIDELTVEGLANKVGHLETETTTLEKMLQQIKPSDLETIRQLAIDLDDQEEIIRELDGTSAGQDLSAIIKDNIKNLKDNTIVNRLKAQNFFSELKDKMASALEQLPVSSVEIEEHILSEKEGALTFQQNSNKTIIENPDIQVYSRERSRRSAKQNWFTSWLSKRKTNETSHINIKVELPEHRKMVQIIKQEESSTSRPKLTNTII